MSRAPICPECGQADQVEKASTLYLVGTEVKWKQGAGRRRSGVTSEEVEPALTALPPVFAALTPNQLQALGQRLAPPATPKGVPLRLIHPDWAVAALTMIAPVFLYGAATSQPGALPLTLVILVGFYGFYFWQRKRILERFMAQQQAGRQADQQVQRAIRSWMGLYYCLRDDCVFDPARRLSVPADQLAGFLLRAAPESLANEDPTD